MSDGIRTLQGAFAATKVWLAGDDPELHAAKPTDITPAWSKRRATDSAVKRDMMMIFFS